MSSWIRGLSAVCVLATLGGCYYLDRPELVHGLYDYDDSHAFDARVVQRFPVGSSEAALVAELERQGFMIAEEPLGEYTRAFDLEGWDGCYFGWSILWKAEAGTLTDIKATAGDICSLPKMIRDRPKSR